MARFFRRVAADVGHRTDGRKIGIFAQDPLRSDSGAERQRRFSATPTPQGTEAIAAQSRRWGSTTATAWGSSSLHS